MEEKLHELIPEIIEKIHKVHCHSVRTAMGWSEEIPPHCTVTSFATPPHSLAIDVHI